jgi:2-polyprenyl-3-methyl-5-hydroxy-6-metoxy-1,4-benzoquinol methylase
MSEAPRLYDDYIAFKGWEDDRLSTDSKDIAALLALARKPQPYRLLDVGFGRGELLDWAKSQGIETHGSEIIPELVERARSRGHGVVQGDLKQLEAGGFDVITAIDVLEHLTVEQLSALLADVRRLLMPDGVFIARFPNGQSPFSGPYQNGDLTHVRSLTPGAIRQVAGSAGLALDGAYNLRPHASGFRGLKRRAAYAFRDAVETLIGFAYYGYRFPMDPNIVIVLRPA